MIIAPKTQNTPCTIVARKADCIVPYCELSAASKIELRPIIINSKRIKIMPQSNSEPDVRLLICREGRCMLMLPRFMYKPLSCS